MAKSLPRSAPEAQGVASAAVMTFVEQADAELDSLHSFMLVRHGTVVAEGWWKPYTSSDPHMMYSLSKSFTSTAVGLLVDERRLSLDDRVVQFFPDDLPAEVSPQLAAMEVRHLLSMSTGHDEDTLRPVVTAFDGNWARAFLAQPVEHAPGTHFVYNSGATYMLSAIVQHTIGMTLLDYLQPRLFEPLGIEHPTWETDPRGINTGGWGLNITTEDIARFGLMYLHKGVWEGQQIVPAAWVEEATASQISNGDDPENDWNQGYGYQFWRSRHNAYRGDGAFGQFCVVLPEHDAVVAITSGVGNMQAVLNLIWTHLLPAFAATASPEDPQAHQALQERLQSLSLVPPLGASTSPIASEVSGKPYVLAPNQWQFRAMTFQFEHAGATIQLEGPHGVFTVEAGWGTWASRAHDGPAIFDGLTNRAQPVVAAGAWTAEDTYTMQWCMYQTPYVHTIHCTFVNGTVRMACSVNVAFGQTEFEPVLGRAEAASSALG
jgi:CubicO group peptidase (beta-lactamase class C family)